MPQTQPLKKMFVRGSAASGKTALIGQLTGRPSWTLQKYRPTIGMDFGKKTLNNGSELLVWDTAGKAEYFDIEPAILFSGTQLIAYCFNVTDKASLEAARDLALKDHKTKPPHSDSPYVVFVGTKADLITDTNPAISNPDIQAAIKTVASVAGKDKVHQAPYCTSAKAENESDPYYHQTQTFFNALPDLCLKSPQEHLTASSQAGDDQALTVARTAHASFFQRNPRVAMGLLITGLALSIAVIAFAAIATCGVAGMLGAAAATLAATMTFGAGLTTVGAVAGGVGLFGGLGIAGASYLIHTKARPALEGNQEPTHSGSALRL